MQGQYGSRRESERMQTEKALQDFQFLSKGMSATSGQHNAKLTKDALKKIRNDDCFATFYQTVLRNKQLHVSITEPEVPRNKRAPGRFEIGTGTPFFPVTPEQVYRRISLL